MLLSLLLPLHPLHPLLRFLFLLRPLLQILLLVLASLQSKSMAMQRIYYFLSVLVWRQALRLSSLSSALVLA